MGVCRNLKERRKEKQRKYELSVLRDIHLKDIRKCARNMFLQPYLFSASMLEELERTIVDYTIEIYLYGASFGKWGYYGEDYEQIKARMGGKENYFVEEFFVELCEKLDFSDEPDLQKTLYLCTKRFVEIWMQEGFQNGTRKYKLKLVQ